MRNLRTIAHRIGSIFRLPNQVSSRGPSRFPLYDHTKCGRDAVNLRTYLFVPGVREYRLHRLPASPLPAARQLSRDGIAVFSMADLAGGEALFEELKANWSEAQASMAGDIEAWHKRQTSADEKKKDFMFPVDVPPSFSEPGWRLAVHPQILRHVNDYMHAHSRIYDLKYWINASDPKAAPKSSQLWHRDGDGTCLKLFIYLNDVGEQTG